MAAGPRGGPDPGTDAEGPGGGREDGGTSDGPRRGALHAGRAPGDHSEADEPIYERMRAKPFEPPDDGFIELVNGPELSSEIDRIVAAVEAAP